MLQLLSEFSFMYNFVTGSSALAFFPSAGVTGVSSPHQSWKYKLLDHLQGAPKMPEMPEIRCGRKTWSSRDGEGGNGFNAHLFLTARLHCTICMTISYGLKTTYDVIVNCSWQTRKVRWELTQSFVLEVGLGTPMWISQYRDQNSNRYGNKASRKAACKKESSQRWGRQTYTWRVGVEERMEHEV